MKTILGFFARSSIYKLIVLYFGMALVDVAIFINDIRGMEYFNPPLGLDYSKSFHYIRLVFIGVFLATVYILAKITSEKGARNGYTLRRLASSEKEVFLVQSLYNMGVFIVLWGPFSLQ